MDGLPKNKKPWNKEHERQQIALDDYLFERKLQEVYDKKKPSNDMPKLLRKLSARTKKLLKKPKKTPQAPKPKKPKVSLIDAPHVPKKRFSHVANKTVVPKPKKAHKRIKPQKKHLVVVGVAAMLGAAVFAVTNLDKSTTKKDTPAVQGATSAPKPDFATLLPNKDVDASKIKFDPTKRVASYPDTIEGGNVVVSQQKLGETELKDTEFLKRTATAFNLKTEVTTKKGAAYIGSNKDTNTQFTFFIYKDFLLLIQAERTYKPQTLVDYIDALQ